MDYLKLTVWASPSEVKEWVEAGIIERFGWGRPVYEAEGWTLEEAGGRARLRHVAGCLSVVEYTDEVCGEKEFCTVEVKGEGCEHLGNEGIRFLLDDLGHRFRVRPSRVDLMAHTMAFTPKQVRDAVNQGQYNSRSVTADNMVFTESSEGDTCYLGMKSKDRGGMKRCGSRLMRFYDRRGPTRAELQLHKEYAHAMGTLLPANVQEWPEFIRGCMRHFCDFVDRDASDRASRCPQLVWWAEFTSTVEKVSIPRKQYDASRSPLCKLDGLIKRHVRRLYAAERALGIDWILERIRKHAGDLRPEDYAHLLEELLAFRGSGVMQVPDLGQDIPI
ncbi:MAG: hypothetical protein KDA20_03190 [Phycisphaerales bacterium]|nr:hypothetical protein [Phycisphaerales bacterium]